MKPDKYHSINDQIFDQLKVIKKAKKNIKALIGFRKGKKLEERHFQINTWHDLHPEVYKLNFDTYSYRIKKADK